MIMTMYAMKDELNGYTTPIPFMTEDIAKRYLKDQYFGNVTVKNSPKDFSIWMIGEYDTDTSNYNPCVPKLIERAENYAG